MLDTKSTSGAIRQCAEEGGAGRPPPAREHAHTVTLLACDAASYLSGANVRINGDWEGIDYCNREGIDY